MLLKDVARKNILLAGATGFVGQALFLRLIDRGHYVTVLTRDAQRAKSIMGEKIPILTWIELDGLSGHEFDVGINLSGATVGKRWTKSYKAEIINSRIESTHKIAEAMSRSRKTSVALLNASGTGIGADQGDTEVSESDEITGTFLSEVGVLWERAVEPHFSTSSEASGNRRAIFLRFGAILHPQAPLWSQLTKPIKMGIGGTLGSGKQWFSFVTLHDAIRAIIFLLESNKAGPFNIVAPEIANQRDFGAALAKRLNKPFRVHTPAFILRIALGEMSSLALDGVHAVPKRLRESGFSFDHVDTAAALNYCFEEAKMFFKSSP